MNGRAAVPFKAAMLRARIERNVEKRHSACWLWLGKLKAGYGVMNIRAPYYAYPVGFLVHRVAHEVFIGPIPEGYVVDHTCRVPMCCNPAHLEAVTQAENCRRIVKGQSFNFRKHWGAMRRLPDAYRVAA